MYKRQRQNFLLLPRLGIPLKNNENKVGLAIQLPLSDSSETMTEIKRFPANPLVCSSAGTHWELPQEFLRVSPTLLNQAQGWEFWNAVATFGLLNTGASCTQSSFM